MANVTVTFKKATFCPAGVPRAVGEAASIDSALLSSMDRETFTPAIDPTPGLGDSAEIARENVSATAAAAAAVAGLASPFRAILNSSQPFTAIGLGDSLTCGNDPYAYHLNVGSWFYQLGFRWGGRMKCSRNAGVPGESAAQIAARFSADVAAHHPQVVFLLSGTNDAAYQAAATDAAIAAQVCQSDCAVIRAALAAGIIPVVCSIYPIAATTNPISNTATVVAVVNAAKRDLCARCGVDFLDTFSAVAGTDGHFLAGMSDDLLHTNEAGASAVADYIIAQFPSLPACGTPFLPQVPVDTASLLPNPLLQRVLNNANAAGLPDSWWDQIPGACTYSLTPGRVGNVLRAVKTSAASEVYPIINLSSCPTPGTRVVIAGKYRTGKTSADFNPLFTLLFFGGDSGAFYLFYGGLTTDRDGTLHFNGPVPAGTTSAAVALHITAGTGWVELEQLAVYQAT